MKKKGLSLFLALAMCVGLLPTMALAEGAQTETVGIYLRTLDKEKTDNPNRSNFVKIPTDQLKALGLAAYYYQDTYGYWVDYGSFSSENAATYNHEKQERNSNGVKAVVAEIASDNVAKKDGITMALPTDSNAALTWDTLSWSDNGGSYSWHLNGELHVCKVHLDLNYEGANSSDASLTRYALVGTDINSGLPTNTPTLSGYNFTGWYTEETGGTKITSIPTLTDDVTYYAHWERRASGTGEHTHYLCGSDSCTGVGEHADNPTTFTAWTEWGSLPADGGAYYLTRDVELSGDYGEWKPADGTILCLNGHTITRRLYNGNSTFSAIEVNSNRSFTLTDCQIIPGTITVNGTVGRGIYTNEGSTFTMYGGNLTEFSSGGVYISGAGNFKMYGGSINNCWHGVYVPWGSGNVQIFGGSIKDNTSYGIFYNRWMGTQKLEVNGNAAITGNKYGIYFSPYDSSDYVNGTSLHVSGAVQIKDNTNGNVRFGKKGNHEVNCVYVDGTLDSSARIGITTATVPTTATTVAQATTENAIKDGNFTSDQDYQVILGNNGKIVQFFKHIHDCNYTLNSAEDTITATCKENDYSGNVQIKAPNEPEYNGEPKAATLDTTDWELDTPKITYTKNGEPFDGVPTDIGTYTASITLGDVTATTSYEITKKVVAIDTDTVTATNRKYDPNSDTVDCDVTFADNANLIKDTDYTVVGTIADKNVGEHEVSVTVTLINPNYTFAGDENTATANTTVTISKANGDNLGTTNIYQRYNDTNEKTVTLNWEQLPTSSWNYESSYTPASITLSRNDIAVDGNSITYALPENGGAIGDEITFTITSIDTNNNYENFTQTIVLHLTDKDIPAVKANDITTTYTGNAVPDSAITGTATFEGKAVEGTWSFETANLVNVADSTENVSVVFTPTDTNAYAIVKDTIKVTINKATPSGTPEYTGITTSDKTLADAELRVGTITPEGTIAWNDGNDTVIEANKAYGWTFTPNDTENYETLTGNITPYVVSSSSSGGGHSSRTSYAVSSTATDNGAISSNVKTARKGDTVTITIQPESGYKLDKLTVTDANGNVLTVTDKGDGTYTFTMPNSKVEIVPTFVAESTTEPEPKPEPTPETNLFTDVNAEDYFFDAVKWAADKNITGGIDTNLFGPNMACTRAQIVTFLWRAAGSPAAQAMNSFYDVAEDAYYAKAVSWAVENGITNGTSEDTFSPDLPCTRAQSMTFLYRASKAQAPDGAPAFSDVAADAYYAAAVKWATENNITSGMGDGLFGPDYECTRAQIVTFLYRLYTK